MEILFHSEGMEIDIEYEGDGGLTKGGVTESGVQINPHLFCNRL
jgi:hypothetical protein